MASELAKATGISTRQATAVLKKYNYQIETAADAVLNGTANLGAATSPSKIEEVFKGYAGKYSVRSTKTPTALESTR